VLEYSPDALMAALNHLVNHKAQGIAFVAMGTPTGPSGSGITCPSSALGHYGPGETCLLACDG
jgi:hypothetical protein